MPSSPPTAAARLDEIRAEVAAVDASPILDHLTALRDAVAGVLAEVAAHNVRVRRWHGDVAAAGAPDRSAPRDGATPPPNIVYSQSGTVTADGRTVSPLDALKLIDVTVHQVARPDVRRMVDHQWVTDFDVPGHVRAGTGG